MDHSRTLLKQTDDELLFCIQNLPLEVKWKNIILSQEEGFYRVEIELYDSLEGNSNYKILDSFNNLEDAEVAFHEERILLIHTLIEAKVVEVDENGDLLPLSFHAPNFKKL